MTTTTQSTTHTLNVPGATLAYDIRPHATTTEPFLLLIGSPMGAAGFGTLAGHFTDRTVVTYDPRGADRSQKTDPARPSTPAEHADDLYWWRTSRRCFGSCPTATPPSPPHAIST